MVGWWMVGCSHCRAKSWVKRFYREEKWSEFGWLFVKLWMCFRIEASKEFLVSNKKTWTISLNNLIYILDPKSSLSYPPWLGSSHPLQVTVRSVAFSVADALFAFRSHQRKKLPWLWPHWRSVSCKGRGFLEPVLRWTGSALKVSGDCNHWIESWNKPTIAPYCLISIDTYSIYDVYMSGVWCGFRETWVLCFCISPPLVILLKLIIISFASLALGVILQILDSQPQHP